VLLELVGVDRVWMEKHKKKGQCNNSLAFYVVSTFLNKQAL
jgi:hypothetical protein